HKLAWKLAAVLPGVVGPGILDTYEAERRRHVWEMIRLALRMGRVMAPRNRLTAWAVQGGFRPLGLCPPARDYIAEMRYKPTPRFASGFLVPDGRRARRTLVGRLLPQPRVVASDHRPVRLARGAEAVAALVGRTSEGLRGGSRAAPPAHRGLSRDRAISRSPTGPAPAAANRRSGTPGSACGPAGSR